MMSARVRKTFRYPDSDTEDETRRPEMDEQEQESLISNLRKQNEEQNKRYKLILTTLPMVCSVVFLPYIFSLDVPALHRFLSILSVLSLLSTAYMTKVFFSMGGGNKTKGPLRDPKTETGMLEKYLNVFNAAASITLVIFAYFLGHPRESGSISFLILIPGVIFLTIRVAERAIISVDVGELEKLKYEFKGA